MKTFNKTILVLLAVVAISLTSCKKDDDGDGGGGDGAASGTISAKVEGSGDLTTTQQLTSGQVVTGGGVSTLVITGSNNNGRNISLTVNGYDGNGSYDVGGSNSVFVVATYTEVDASNPQNAESWVAPYDTSVAGEVNITESSATKIKGTFTFRGKSNQDGSFKNITEGTFDVNL